MFCKLSSCIFLLISLSAAGQQFKYDKVLYKTVTPDELCATLEKNKGYLLLDVRSSGEHYDTSQFTGLNIGHLKGAMNINVRELGGRLPEIATYKHQPVFVYCSHSQRSRRASKMLADSGFTNVYNINGGLTAFYYTNAKANGCLPSLIETADKYKIISAFDLCSKLVANSKDLFLLDVRTDSAFKHISTEAQDNAYGHIKNSVNIPLAQLANKISEVPKNKDIIVIDLDGSDASKAAALLKTSGYEKVSMLIEGIDRLVNTDANDLPCKTSLYVSAAPYPIISSKEFGRMAIKNKDLVLLDIRDAAAFANTHKDLFRNVGHLKNAVNIPEAEIINRITDLEKYKNTDLIIYSFGGGREAYDVASQLAARGFTKLNVLANGLFGIRWAAANIKGQEYLNDFVKDVPELNR